MVVDTPGFYPGNIVLKLHPVAGVVEVCHRRSESKKSAAAKASAVCLIAPSFSFGKKARNSAPKIGKKVTRVKNIIP